MYEHFPDKVYVCCIVTVDCPFVSTKVKQNIGKKCI